MRLEYLNEERYCPECGLRPVRRGRQFCKRCTILRQREGIGQAEPDYDVEDVSASEFLGATSHLDAPQPTTQVQTTTAPDSTDSYTADQVYELYLQVKKSGNTELAKKLYDKWLEM